MSEQKGRNSRSGVRFSPEDVRPPCFCDRISFGYFGFFTSILLARMFRKLRAGLFGSEVEIRTDIFLDGIWSSGGFRRVGSCVRIRKLLTRASGTLLASRLGRDKIWDFGR